MTKKFLFSFVMIVMIILTSACSSLQIATTPANATAEATQTALTNNIGIGLIKLEGSALQVTAAQANDLLLLWKGVKLLSTSKTASAIELAALYEQIQGSLTAEQIAAIRVVTWSQDEVNQAIQKYSDSSVAVAAAKKTTTTSSSGGMDMGPGGGMGGPGGDMGAISGASSSSSSSNTSSSQAKAIAASKSNSTASASLNAQLADAIIGLLKQRVSG
jgi:hypothetical protein